MALDALDSAEAREIWVDYNGGEWVLDADPQALNALRERLAALPYALEIEHCLGWMGVIHADIPLDISWSYLMHRLAACRT